MIKVLKQTTEYYCSTEEEAENIVSKRKEESVGDLTKRNIETKENYIKLTITEEFNVALELAKNDPHDPNEYYELLDDNGEVYDN